MILLELWLEVDTSAVITVAAVILGMGTNAAYVERKLEVPKCHGPLPFSGEMVSDHAHEI